MFLASHYTVHKKDFKCHSVPYLPQVFWYLNPLNLNKPILLSISLLDEWQIV